MLEFSDLHILHTVSIVIYDISQPLLTQCLMMCSRYMMRIVSLLSLLWSLVEVHCQPAPYVTFMGNTVPNHGYVDLGQVGDNENGADSVQCHTDLNTCCSGEQGNHRGDWVFPNGTTRLPFSGDIFENRVAQRVDLHHRNNANSPVGIYHCYIPTIAVLLRDTVYVGLYTASGGMGEEYNTSVLNTFMLHVYMHNRTRDFITILFSLYSGDVMISGDLTYDSDQLTLSCISTGGPATTVSWTRDSTTVITEGTETVLNDTVTAQYTHTLTISTAGEYTCTVANDKPSTTTSNSITVTGMHTRYLVCVYDLPSFKCTIIEGSLQIPIENNLKCLVPTKCCEISDLKSASMGFHNRIMKVLSLMFHFFCTVHGAKLLLFCLTLCTWLGLLT